MRGRTITMCAGAAATMAAAIGLSLMTGGCASTSPGQPTNTPTRKPTSTPQPTNTPVPTPTPAVAQAWLITIGGSDAAGAVAYSDVMVAGLDSAGNVMPWSSSPDMLPTPVLTGGTLPITSAMWGVKAGLAPPYSFLYGNSAEPQGTSFGFSNYSAFAPVTLATVGPWADGTPMANPATTPVFCIWGNAVTDGSYVYLVESSSGVSYGYAGTVSGGQVVQWTEQSAASLGMDTDSLPLVGANGYLFTVGGRSGTTVLSSIYRASYGSGSIGAFSLVGNFPITVRRSPHQCVPVTVSGQTYLYFAGGFNGASEISTVYYTTVSSTGGTLGTWQTTTALPYTVSYADVVSWSNLNDTYLYLIGGQTGGSTGYSSVYKAVVNSNGTLGNWVSQQSLPSERMMTASVVF